MIVTEEIVDGWVASLPARNPLHIVSLLGEKFHGGHSEFRHYPFRSCLEDGSKPTFQEWLDKRRPGRFVVHEFCTVDADPDGIPADVVDKVRSHIKRLLEGNQSVVVVDSAGVSRTGRVCKGLGTIGRCLTGPCA